MSASLQGRRVRWLGTDGLLFTVQQASQTRAVAADLEEVVRRCRGVDVGAGRPQADACARHGGGEHRRGPAGGGGGGRAVRGRAAAAAGGGGASSSSAAAEEDDAWSKAEKDGNFGPGWRSLRRRSR